MPDEVIVKGEEAAQVESRITVDRKQVLATPIDRGDYTVKNRTLSRIHIQEDGYTLYFQEAGAEVGYHKEWTAETKAAYEAFLNT